MDMWKCIYRMRDGGALRHLIQARHKGEALRLAREGQYALGALDFDLGG